jgi:hypothetical protein
MPKHSLGNPILFFLLVALFYLAPVVASDSETGEEKHSLRFSFERGIPQGLEIDSGVARITTDPAYVITGKGSLLCDTRPRLQEWHEFLITEPDVRFEAEHRYSVSFVYRVLQNMNADFFCVLRRRGDEGEKASGGGRMFAPWWTGERGDEGRREAEFLVPSQGDWMLVMGVHKRAALVIDELEIRETGADQHHRFIPRLLPGTFHARPGLEAIRKLNQDSGLAPVLEESVVVGSAPPGCGEERALAVVNRLSPDIVLGGSGSGFGINHGIRSIGVTPGYATLDPRWVPGILWHDRFDFFVDKGFVLPLSGKLPGWTQDEYPMCVNAAFWGGLETNTAVTMLDASDGLVVPGIGGTMAQDAEECFCKSCNGAFREWLRSIYDARDLRAWGIRDLDEFSLRTYRLRSRREGEALLDDLVLREWIRWKHSSHVKRWTDYVAAIKEEGARRGRAIPVGASPQVGGASNPYTVAVGSYHDFWVVSPSVESAGFSRFLSQIPLWLGSGLRGSPVLVTAGSVGYLREGGGGFSDPDEQGGLFAGALALGALPVFPGLRDQPATSWEGVVGSEEEPLPVWRHPLRELILRYRSLYSYRRSYHNVAVVYSIPTLIWETGIERRNGHYEAFVRTCEALRDANIPFDVLIFDHPLMFPERERLRLVGKYGAILLPGVQCMSEAQVIALLKFEESGGKLFAAEPCAEFDENYNPRLRVPAGLGSVEPWSLSDPEEALAALRELSWLRLPRVGPDLAGSVWRSQRGKMYAIHLARVSGSGKTTAFPVSLEVSLQVPSSFTPETVVFLTPENPNGIPVKTLKAPSGRLVSQAPVPSTYGVLAYSEGGYLEKASQELNARREKDRERVKENLTGWGASGKREQ